MNDIYSKSPYKEIIATFLKFCEKNKYPPKTDIIKIGDIGDRLYFIIEGSVAIFAENEASDQSNDLILAYLGKNEFIGEIGIFKGEEVRKVNVRTRESCVLAEISYAYLKEVLHKDLLFCAPDILYLIGEQLATRLLATSNKLCELAFIVLLLTLKVVLHMRFLIYVNLLKQLRIHKACNCTFLDKKSVV